MPKWGLLGTTAGIGSVGIQRRTFTCTIDRGIFLCVKTRRVTACFAVINQCHLRAAPRNTPFTLTPAHHPHTYTHARTHAQPGRTLAWSSISSAYRNLLPKKRFKPSQPVAVFIATPHFAR